MCWKRHRKAEQLVHIPEALAAGVPVIKRFSGGGTVAVDRDTVFGTLIMDAAELPAVECYPRPIMAWSEGFYGSVFSPYGPFGLRDNGGSRVTYTLFCARAP